ncbi:MAG: DUF4345 domain-containing protein [Hyphomonas sp.]|uniref:DUF4345 family protein n=1 Tax=Hyphomonas sp. TaxID=87 RepID=UPI0037BE6404|nr:DUF4345 domain-containing protein [Hyphomonas sp.]
MIAVMGAAMFYGVIGLAAITRPQTLLKGFGIEAIGPESRNEIRGAYGGFPFVVAGLLLFALTRPDVSDGILLALAASSAGMALGRIVFALTDRQLGRYPAIFLVLEMAAAMIIASDIRGL